MLLISAVSSVMLSQASPTTPPTFPAQGLQWYTSSMRQDADGDLADQFLSEPSSGHGAKRSYSGRERELPSLQVRPTSSTGCRRSSCSAWVRHGMHSMPKHVLEAVCATVQTQHGQLQQAAAADVIVDRGNVYVVPVS